MGPDGGGGSGGGAVESCGVLDRLKTRCVKCVPKCASVRVASSNIVYYCTDIDPQGKVS